MLEGVASKFLAFLAREAVPFILSIVIRQQMKKVEKKIEHMND